MRSGSIMPLAIVFESSIRFSNSSYNCWFWYSFSWFIWYCQCNPDKF